MQHIKYIIFGCFLSLLGINKINAKEPFIEKKRISVYFGFRDIQHDSLANTQNIDFMNYLNSEDDFYEYDFLGFSGHYWLRGNWEADIKLAMFDDFVPNNFNISAQYFPLKFIGFNLGVYGYPQYIMDHDFYHNQTDPDFFAKDNRYLQQTVYDSGIIGGPILRLDLSPIHLDIKLNGGWGSFLSFSEEIYQKKQDSNFKRVYRYKTKRTSSPFIFPEAELSIDCFKISQKMFGLRFQTSWYKTNRAIDYERTTYEWTTSDFKKETIKSPKHKYEKFEFDFGVFLKW